MPMLVSAGGPEKALSSAELKTLVHQTVANTGIIPKKVLLLPPDLTRYISRAGEITNILYELLSPSAQVDIMPALGTHSAMTEKELRAMFGDRIPLSCFKVHNWRDDVVAKGVVPGAKLKEWSEGKVDYDVKVEVNKILFAGYDLILSVGQVVPHEVVGMANYTKNIMVGVGGADTINKSHFLGAVYNMERILGKGDNPVRKLFNAGVNDFLGDLPIFYLLTVVGRDQRSGKMEVRGFFSGADQDAFLAACELSKQVNINIMDEPVQKIVVHLEPEEFKSTWLGNKSVYRTRMVLADGGELLILAPGLKEFGEDKEIDRLIRKYGYRGTDATLAAVRDNEELRNNLSAAAHLIHGSSEGRFSITYCPGKLSREEIESVNFKYADLKTMMSKYNPAKLRDGFNTMPDGERIYYISNPAAGLWAYKGKI